jgi:hypothetical protein
MQQRILSLRWLLLLFLPAAAVLLLVFLTFCCIVDCIYGVWLFESERGLEVLLGGMRRERLLHLRLRSRRIGSTTGRLVLHTESKSREESEEQTNGKGEREGSSSGRSKASKQQRGRQSWLSHLHDA